MDIASLITIARKDYLADSVNEYLWDNAFMLRSFTEAQRQACNRTNFNYEEFSITLINGTTSYIINPRITKLVNVIFEGNILEKLSQEALDVRTPLWRTETAMTGKECRYAIRGNKIRFVPSPLADDDGLVVTLEAYSLPDVTFESTDEVPSIPEEFHRDLVHWVLYEALSKRDMDTFNIKAKDYLDKFESVFGQYVSAQVRQHQLENGLSMIARPFNYNKTAERLNTSDDW